MEPTDSRFRGKLLAACFSAALVMASIMPSALYANPQGGSVAAGSATISNSGNQTTINQSTNKAIINWQGFSIGPQETTQFVQPSSSSISLNRVTGNNNPSQIEGALRANGQVWLINPSGIMFHKGSQVNVAGILATTANIKDADFMAGNYHFIQSPDHNVGIVNEGNITVQDRGLVALVAPAVSNSGTITAHMGKVTLASGTEFTVDLVGDQLIQFATGSKVTQTPTDPNGRPMRDSVANHGQIYADGGQVVLSAHAAEGVVDHSINMDGVIQARSISTHNGQIVLAGNDGITQVSGTMDVSGLRSGETGGTIHITGHKVGVLAGAHLNASGNAGGGTILIGGDYQGKGVIPKADQAELTYIDKAAVIEADATDKGNGGKVVAWSDVNNPNSSTRVYGTISAKGGPNGGDGGLVETSGHYLDVAGASVSTVAPMGKTGMWLLDPGDVSITNTSPSSPGTFPTSWTSGCGSNTILCAPGNSSNLYVGDLLSFLQGTSVTVQAVHTNENTGEVRVETPISSNSTPIGNSLTLTPDVVHGGQIEFHNDGAINIPGSIILNGPTVLVNDLTSAPTIISQNGSVSFVGTVTGFSSGGNPTFNALVLSTPGVNQTTTFNDNVTALNSLILQNAVVINTNTSTISTVQGQTYNGSVTLGTTTALSGSTLSVGGNIVGGGNGLTLTFSGLSTLNANGSNTSGLSSLTSNGTGILTIQNNINTTGNQSYSSPLTLGANSATLTSSAGSVSIDSIGGNGNWTSPSTLTVNSNGDITIGTNNSGYSINASGGGNLTLSAPTANIIINGGIHLLGGTTTTQGILTLTAKSAANSITTSNPGGGNIGGAINVNNFNLVQGQWSQNNSSLPNFSVQNNFQLQSGTKFTRVAGGTGNPGSPFELIDIYGLQGAATLSLGNEYNVDNDINASGTQNWSNGGNTGFIPIGDFSSNTGNFEGLFESNNLSVRQIQNILINAPNTASVGLFANVVGGTFANIGITGTITGQNAVGALIGNIVNGANGVTIQNVFSDAVVTSTGNSGGTGGLIGVIGSNTTNTLIEVAYSTGKVIGNVSVGGLIGAMASGTVQNTFSAANVTANGTANGGGLVGTVSNSPTIATSYSTGAVLAGSGSPTLGGFIGSVSNTSTITANFWDTDTSSQASGVGSGLQSGTTGGCFTGNCFNGSTVQLSAKSTYPSPPWSISLNGATTWNITEGASYPFLREFSGNNPQAFSGIAYSDQGNTHVGAGIQISLVDNGVLLSTVSTDANGFFYFQTGAAAGDNILAYINNAGTQGSTITAVDKTDPIVTMNIYGNTIRGVDTNTLSNTNLGNAVGQLSDTDFLYSVTNNALALNPNVNFQMNVPYTINGSISGSNTPLTFANNVSVTAASTLATGSGNINFQGNISNANSALTLNSSGVTTFGTNSSNTISGLGSLTTNAAGTTTIHAGSITTSGSQTYNDPLTLTGTPQFTTSNGTIAFNNGATGSGGLTTFGPTQLAGTFTIGGAVTFNNAVTLANDTNLSAGSITTGSTISGNHNLILSGTTSLGGNVSTGPGSQTYNGTINLTSSPISLSSTGTITLNTVNGNQLFNVASANILNLNNAINIDVSKLSGAATTVNLNNPVVTITKAEQFVANFGNLNVTASYYPENVVFNRPLNLANNGPTSTMSLTSNAPLGIGGTWSTGGNMSLNNTVSLKSATNLSANGGNMVFGNTINGNQNLVLAASGMIDLAGPIGNNTPLASFTSNTPATATTANLAVNAGRIFMRSLQGDNATLNGTQGIFANVILNGLTLNGDQGATINGIIGGFSDFRASIVAHLASSALGDFIVNGCVLPGGCVANTVSNTPDQMTNRPIDQLNPPACTLNSALQGGNSNCGGLILIKEENVVAL